MTQFSLKPTNGFVMAQEAMCLPTGQNWSTANLGVRHFRLLVCAISF
jgi:hypothetical protein